MSKALDRRVRREANKLLRRRRYREMKNGLPMPYYSVRVGPSGPSAKAEERARKKAGLEKSKIIIPTKSETDQLLKKAKKK